MANFVFNVAKGRHVELFNNVANDTVAAAVINLSLWTAVEADATLKDNDTMAAIVAGANTECAAASYARGTQTDTDLTAFAIDDTNERQGATMTDEVWGTIESGAAIVKLIACYDPLGTNVNANLIPLYAWDFSVTPNGGSITADFPVTDAMRATD